ncbi:DinB family protein [Oceanobacillus saliphilus]|uniref:DinB family protein n=1 Tax=Oceanobacillus saliphilus TaxID=2925834 RepID=UPI00201DC02D|nr:DinB family protein [Oceanobacillus saliphilus]
MYRKVEDFLEDWAHSAKGTIQVLESLTDDKLDQAIVEGHSTLGWLGWHITTSTAFFAGLVGLDVTVPSEESVPKKAAVIPETYKEISEKLVQEIKEKLTDEKMVEEVDQFGRLTPRGAILRDVILHQTHHRGQMTVLLRQAGLHVPGVMGPTKEQGGY